jgi:hypothetical protein
MVLQLFLSVDTALTRGSMSLQVFAVHFLESLVSIVLLVGPSESLQSRVSGPAGPLLLW